MILVQNIGKWMHSIQVSFHLTEKLNAYCARFYLAYGYCLFKIIAFLLTCYTCKCIRILGGTLIVPKYLGCSSEGGYFEQANSVYLYWLHNIATVYVILC